MNAIIVDGDPVSDAEDVCDRLCTLFVKVVKLEDAFDEIRWILGIRLASRCLNRRNRAGVSVLLCELLDAALSDVVSIGDVLSVKVMIDNQPTDPVNIILL